MLHLFDCPGSSILACGLAGGGDAPIVTRASGITKSVIANDKICKARRLESAISQVTQHQINGLASRRSMILSGIRLAECKDELRKKRKGRNDQGNGGCADCFDPSLFLRIKLTGSLNQHLRVAVSNFLQTGFMG